MPTLDEVIQKLGGLNTAARKKVVATAKAATRGMTWIPNPGPQTDAYLSLADILLYGGEAGGGKSQLAIGWGVNEAENGIVFRRELTQTDGLEKDGKTIIKATAGFNGTDREWTWPSGKSFKIGAMRQADSWNDHAGRERDYMAFDEGGEFLEIQVASIIAWLRAPAGKRTRVIIPSNPPRTSEGLWLIDWFAPWLDEKHPLYPQPEGHLLWALLISKPDGSCVTHWVEGPGEYEVEGERYTAMSRTFIRASLTDNPYRNNPEYIAKLQALPEPLRSQLLHGDFKAGLKDNANQCIPTSWARAAQQRWTDNQPADVPMCSMGVDCTGGGDDPMVIAPRFDGWYPNLIKIPGAEIPQEKLGSYAAGFVVAHRKDGALVIVDMGGGYGGPLYGHLHDNDIACSGYKGAAATTRRSRDGKLQFTNTRSAAYWGFREALDPDQPGGSPIKLPPDNRLLAGLTCPTFEVTPNGIKVEPKVTRNNQGKVIGGVMAKLGFSPDEADAVVMAWFEGPKETTQALEWIERAEMKRGLGRTPRVLPRGRDPLSARR